MVYNRIVGRKTDMIFKRLFRDGPSGLSLSLYVAGARSHIGVGKNERLTY